MDSLWRLPMSQESIPQFLQQVNLTCILSLARPIRIVQQHHGLAGHVLIRASTLSVRHHDNGKALRKYR